MTLHRIDVLVIGAGTAGMSATREAADAGKQFLLVESGPYGTTCARVGCMPSKLLIAAADAAHNARHALPFGLSVDVKVDRKAVMERVRRERDRFVSFALEEVEKLPQTSKLRGHARFVSDDRVQVGADVEIQADAIVLATGAKSVIPDEYRGLGNRAITSDDIFELEELPASVVVFGAGVIGMELGQALARLGVRVSIIGSGGKLLTLTDPEVVEVANDIFTDELSLAIDPHDVKTELQGDEVVVSYRQAAHGERITERFEYALVAVGRAPAVKDLGLENTSLKLDKHGVPVFDRHTMQAGNSRVFIAGDASSDVPLLHEAIDQGKIAGRNAARYPEVEPGLRRTPLSVVFTDPGVAMVGARHADLDAGTFVTGSVDFRDQGRSRIMLKNRGMMHVYADKTTGRLLGAEWIGPAAEHLAHTLAWAIQQRLTLAQIMEMPVYHPVIEEGMRDALASALDKLS